MTKTIAVNGKPVEVLDALSSGPGNTPHTYELKGRAYVYAIAGTWYLQTPGRCPVTVEVRREDA